MALQEKIPIPEPQQIASYNYADIQEGSGITVYYGYAKSALTASGQSEALTYALTTQSTMNSHQISTSVVPPNSDPSKFLDLDFDLVFNRPQNIKGKAKVIGTAGCRDITGDVDTRDVSYGCIVRKVSGGTETDIATGYAEQITFGQAASGTKQSVPFNIEVDVPLTHYKKGDTLRMTMEAWTHAGGSSAFKTIGIGHDPANRVDDASITTGDNIITSASDTQLIFHIPFILKE